MSALHKDDGDVCLLIDGGIHVVNVVLESLTLLTVIFSATGGIYVWFDTVGYSLATSYS